MGPIKQLGIRLMVRKLSSNYEDIKIIVEQDTADELEPHIPTPLYTTSDKSEFYEKTDLLVTLGGDGTILHASSLFAGRIDVPPILSFSMGTLGFLLPFDIHDSLKAFNEVYSSKSKVMNRSRLRCEVFQSRPNLDIRDRTLSIHAMNDINIHRGSDPHLTMLDINVDGQFVTRAIADGVVVSTPTGSTAYSLSAGGSIVHPSVSCVLITPICPRSLSFRPLIFPATSRIVISVPPESRSSAAELSIDGIGKGMFNPNDRINVKIEEGLQGGIWCVASSETEWVQHLNGLLGFNSTFGGVPSRH